MRVWMMEQMSEMVVNRDCGEVGKPQGNISWRTDRIILIEVLSLKLSLSQVFILHVLS